MSGETTAWSNAIFAAVCNADRRKILDLLRDGEKPAGVLVAAFPRLPQPAVSRHLRILREAGLVAMFPRAQQRIYSIRPLGLREVDAWVSLYRGFWSDKLDSLDEHLGRGATQRGGQMMELGADPSVGQVIIEGNLATLVFRRHLDHPVEVVWKALTTPEELSGWYMTTAKIDGRKGGTIDFRSGPSRLHVTGRILTWDSPHVFEHEWKVNPRPELPSGEDAVIRWELLEDGRGTILRLEHRKLNRGTALGFAPGTHAFMDRLEDHLAGRPLANWQERYRELAPGYPPSWVPR